MSLKLQIFLLALTEHISNTRKLKVKHALLSRQHYMQLSAVQILLSEIGNDPTM